MSVVNSARYQVGDDLPLLVKDEITHVQLVKYAGASGDFNPIHTVVPVGEEAGFGGVIAHGLLIMSFAGQAIGSWFARPDLRRFKVRFAAVTKPGERITIGGKVIEELSVGDEKFLRCQVLARNQDGELKLKGEFEVKMEG